MIKTASLYPKRNISGEFQLSWRGFISNWKAFSILVFFFLFRGTDDLRASVQQSSSLYVGASSVDITPTLPVALDGQMQVRIAEAVETPLTANVVLIDARRGDEVSDISVWISCDLVTVPTELLELIRRSVKKRLPKLDPDKIIVNATHTHTAGVVRDGWYSLPEGVTKVRDYQRYIADRAAQAVEEAWMSRAPGSMSYGMNYAKVAYNRRAVYADGKAQMYGRTDSPEFRRIEGLEDQSVNSIFFWNNTGQLIATCINVASPAQVVESRSVVNADYWHPVREALQSEYGKDLVVLGWIGAAGDQAPRPMYDHPAERRMLELSDLPERGKLGVQITDFRTDSHMREIASRIVASVTDTYEVVKNNRHREVSVDHRVIRLELPMRVVTEAEFEDAKKMRDEDLNDPERAVRYSRRIAWQEEVLERYENQRENPRPMYPVEIHVMRVGDLVICTNPFELFTDFGIQIKSKSKAVQTFVVQLVGAGTYVPTQEAVNGGHYSAIVQSNRVGPEGGQVLVDRTVNLIDELWP